MDIYNYCHCEEDIMIIESFMTPDFPYKVIRLFPDELCEEEIFKNNLSHILDDLKELIRESKSLEGNQRILECLKFDSQKEKQLKLIDENRKRIYEIDDKMNKEISPYTWVIHKDFHGYLFGKYVQADYVLTLCKKGLN